MSTTAADVVALAALDRVGRNLLPNTKIDTVTPSQPQNSWSA